MIKNKNVTLQEKYKLAIAYQIGDCTDLVGMYCWADLIAWAFNHQGKKPSDIINDQSACKEESLNIDCKRCYCGKYENGQCFDLLPKVEQDALIEENKRLTIEADKHLPF